MNTTRDRSILHKILYPILKVFSQEKTNSLITKQITLHIPFVIHSARTAWTGKSCGISDTELLQFTYYETECYTRYAHETQNMTQLTGTKSILLFIFTIIYRWKTGQYQDSYDHRDE